MRLYRQFIQSIMIMAVLFTAGLADYIHAEEQQPKMDVHFIDVGQGDSILIETPSDKTILIDGGPPKAGEKVVAYLKEQQVKKINLLIATHPDIDHIGGLTDVMKTFKVDRLIDSGKIHSTKTYARYISEVLKKRIPTEIAHKNDLIKIDPLLKMRVLNTHSGSGDSNASSIAVKISYKEIDFLLMADIEKEREKKLMKRYDLQSEILKVAHHGSHTSTFIDFLKEVNPEVAVLTYSKKNNFGHPVDRVIDNLKKVNAAIYSTEVFGNTVISTNGEDYHILNERSPSDNLKAG